MTRNSRCIPISMKSHVFFSTTPTSSSSISLPRRFGTGTPTRTPLVAAAHAQPLLRAQLQLAVQLITRVLAVDEVAEAAAHTALAAVQPAAGLAEIGDGRQLAVDGARGVPARVQRIACLLRAVFVLESRVHVSDQIFCVVRVSKKVHHAIIART